MKRRLIIYFAALSAAGAVLGQEHLIPYSGVSDQYDLKLEQVLALAYDRDVILKVMIPNPVPGEYVVGIRRAEAGAEAFIVRAASPVWDTETLRMYESGQVETFTLDGTKVPLNEDEHYLDLKKRTPADYRDIGATVIARPIDCSLVERISAIWRDMILAVSYPVKPRTGVDGITYHFSMWLGSRGQVGGHVWSPEPESQTGQLVSLARALEKYAAYEIDGQTLQVELEAAEKSLRPNISMQRTALSVTPFATAKAAPLKAAADLRR